MRQIVILHIHSGMKKVLKNILFYGFLLITLVLLIGRNHYLLGTALIVGRWFLVVIGLLCLLRVRKYGFTPRLKIFAAAVFVLLADSAYNVISFANLKADERSHALSLFSYNVYFKNKTPEQSLNLIDANHADVMALQEVDMAWKQWIDKRLAPHYAYKAINAFYGTHGLAVYSRFPIISSKLVNNSAGKPIAQLVELNVKGKKVLVINAHLASPAAAVEHPENFLPHFKSSYLLRQEQVALINQYVRNHFSHTHARFFMGDLNTTLYEPLFREIRQTWVNLHDAIGKGSSHTFPASRPLLSIDYILAQGNVQPVKCEVVSGGTSDHLAIWGEVKL